MQVFTCSITLSVDFELQKLILGRVGGGQRFGDVTSPFNVRILNHCILEVYHSLYLFIFFFYQFLTLPNIKYQHFYVLFQTHACVQSVLP